MSRKLISLGLVMHLVVTAQARSPVWVETELSRLHVRCRLRADFRSFAMAEKQARFDPERISGCTLRLPADAEADWDNCWMVQELPVKGYTVFDRGISCLLCPTRLRHNRLLWTRAIRSRPRCFPHSLNAQRKGISRRSVNPRQVLFSPTSKCTWCPGTKQRRSGDYSSTPK